MTMIMWNDHVMAMGVSTTHDRPAMRRVTYVASEKLAKVGHLRNSECLFL
jgi:hypothetical protein